MQHYPSPLHTLSSDSLSRQHFKAAIKVKISLKRKQRCGWETVCILANIFSTHHKLGLSGKVTRFPVRNILEVVRNGGRETQKECSRFCVWSSGTKQHDHAEHHENVPQRDEDSKVSEAQQELPDVVTCAGLPRLLPKALRVLLFQLKVEYRTGVHQQRPKQQLWLVTELRVHTVTVVTTQGIACKFMDLIVQLSVLEGY